MEVFISPHKIVKCSLICPNDLIIFYDYLHEDDINHLLHYLLDADINTHTIYGKINRNNFSISVVEHYSNLTEYNDIEKLLQNKFYKPILKLTDIIYNLKKKQSNLLNHSNFDKIFQDAIDTLTIYTENLKNENTRLHKSEHLTSNENKSKSNSCLTSSLTEFLSDSESDQDDDNKYYQNVVDLDDYHTITNI